MTEVSMKPSKNLAEWIEKRAWQELFELASPELKQELGLSALCQGAALVLSCRADPNLLLNRIIGAQRAAELAWALNQMQISNINSYFVHIDEDELLPSVATLLKQQDVVPYRRSWAKYMRQAFPVGPVRNAFQIESARPSDGPDLGRILAYGFDMSHKAAALWGNLVGRRNWHIYVARHDQQVVAAGVLYVFGDVGYLMAAATTPSQRRKGAQAALMARRIRRAHQLGCNTVIKETGVRMPDEANPSQSNIERFGFKEICVRANYAPRGTTWNPTDGSDGSTAELPIKVPC